MFKFNFNVEEDCDNKFLKGLSEEKDLCSNSDANIDWYDSQKIDIDEEIINKLDVFKLNSVEKRFGEVTIIYIKSGLLLQNVFHDEMLKDIKAAEESHSDLLPGIYEGGAKIWECTDDLLEYISAHKFSFAWQEKLVLDLGCGSGLLGIYSYKCGATVHFQDYNEDVLKEITIPNFLLNNLQSVDDKELDIKKINGIAKFYSGDWEKYYNVTKNDARFDLILTSETIYNIQNQEKLLNCFDTRLASNGIILVAAKTYYFGVGGGVKQFEKLIAEDGRFCAKVVWTVTEGIGRAILELRRKDI
ncbi:histidine protein methyltransferase 1 homolog [Teleopsis dalmanni]|uniref:histidine protein methyltransferase 1 homolog n=1 Tax=Teleopsis dalmanni TaxID=139649 RepID=UPI0018CFB3C9|nr:histidine protein methyltransferase 1 homolog [Teleopsis dalmanni]